MSLLGKLFAKPRAESVVLLDIGAGAVAGAYAHYAEKELPTLLYAKEIPIEVRSGEAPEVAMVRALETLCGFLVTEGAPTLQRAVGSGAAETILVSVDAPWQTTTMRVEHLDPGHAFTFTQRTVTEALAAASTPPAGHVLVDESLVGTILDGYETHEPFGKRATHATIIVLASSIATPIAESVALVLRRVYHTKNILLIAGVSMRYQAVRAAFPLEQDCLILDATGSEVALALVRRGLLVATHDASDGTEGGASWIAEVRTGLAALAQSYPLPHVIFLLAEPAAVEKLTAALGAADLGSLWLSDNPPKIVSLTSQHLSAQVKIVSGDADLGLSLLTLYATIGLMAN